MLSDKQQKFVQELVKNGGNRRAAYKAAFGENVKDNTASANASKLLNKTDVRLSYEKLISQANAKAAEHASKDRLEAQEAKARADVAAADIRAELIDFYRRMMAGEIGDSTTMYDEKSETWKEVKRVVKASDMAAAADKLAEFYGVTPQPNDTIRVELVGGAEDLAD